MGSTESLPQQSNPRPLTCGCRSYPCRGHITRVYDADRPTDSRRSCRPDDEIHFRPAAASSKKKSNPSRTVAKIKREKSTGDKLIGAIDTAYKVAATTALVCEFVGEVKRQMEQHRQENNPDPEPPAIHARSGFLDTRPTNNSVQPERNGSILDPIVNMSGIDSGIRSITLRDMQTNRNHARFERPKKWITTADVVFRSFTVTRTLPPDRPVQRPCYLFKREQMRVGHTICFEVMDIFDNQMTGAIRFGVTIRQPDDIERDVLTLDAMEMRGDGTFLSTTINVMKGQKVYIRRTPAGCLLSLDQDFIDTRIDPVIRLHRDITVYPFINFYGGVRVIHLFLPSNRNAVARTTTDRQTTNSSSPLAGAASASGPSSSLNKTNECLVCFEAERVVMVTPCNHVVYCETCERDAVATGVTMCPVCRGPVSSYTRIYL